MIRGINHATFAVSDLERSLRFYTETLGLEPAAIWDVGAHLRAGEGWVALIVDPNTRKGPLPEYTHLAFSVPPERFAGARDRIARAGAEVWQENPTPGDSFYFLDPDGHRLEIHASDLDARLRAERENPPPGMRFYPWTNVP